MSESTVEAFDNSEEPTSLCTILAKPTETTFPVNGASLLLLAVAAAVTRSRLWALCGGAPLRQSVALCDLCPGFGQAPAAIS